MNNSFGEILRTTIFGASHAEEVGVRIEGVPVGVLLNEALFAQDLERRRPQLRGETPRREEDTPIIEGVDGEGLTTGECVVIRFKNSNKRSGDYSKFEHHPRPSHADLVQRRLTRRQSSARNPDELGRKIRVFQAPLRNRV